MWLLRRKGRPFDAPSFLGLAQGRLKTRRAARPDPSLRKERLLGMTSKLHHYPKAVPYSQPAQFWC
jgi:hypothetical protein